LHLRAPDTAKIKPKMIYAGSKDALVKNLVGVSVKINATDSSELTEDGIKEQCRKIGG
jgi:cofilin